MSPALLLTTFSINKKYLLMVLATLMIIVALPLMAVFALGTSTLTILFDSISAEVAGLYEGPVSTTDTYAWGNCTYWVSLLRQQAKDPIPNTWGNAATWAFYARLNGYVVNNIPSVGAIMQISDVDNGLGHVAYVTAVNPTTGAWTISEMNVKGFDIVDTKTMPFIDALEYNFIHDKAN